MANGPLDGTCWGGPVFVKAMMGDLSYYLYGYDEYGLYAWCNYVVVYVSDGYVGFEDQQFVGYIQVDDTSITEQYVGPAIGQNNYIWIFTFTPAWEPYPYSPHI